MKASAGDTTGWISPDGAVFDQRAAWKKHVAKFYAFRGMKNRALDRLPGEIGGQEFQMSDLEGCTVRILDVADRIICTSLTNCNIFIAPCMETVVLRKCTDCTFTVACKDLRLTDCDGAQYRHFQK